jgi:hypothetical protein
MLSSPPALQRKTDILYHLHTNQTYAEITRVTVVPVVWRQDIHSFSSVRSQSAGAGSHLKNITNANPIPNGRSGMMCSVKI